MLDFRVANTIACSIVNTRLDYCNSLLYGTSARNIGKLQRVQKSLARVVACTKPVLKDLHWLPVRQRIQYKVALITHKVLATSQPQYLAELMTAYKPTRSGLRSEAQQRVVIPTGLKTTYGCRTFTRASEYVWNSLPENLRTTTTLLIFKSKLKTHLFSTAFCL